MENLNKTTMQTEEVKLPKINLKETVFNFEKDLVKSYMKKNNNNIKKTSQDLDISLNTLYKKINQLGLNEKQNILKKYMKEIESKTSIKLK